MPEQQGLGLMWQLQETIKLSEKTACSMGMGEIECAPSHLPLITL